MVSPLWQDMQETMNKEMRKSFVDLSEELPCRSLYSGQCCYGLATKPSIHGEKELHGQ